MHRPWPTNVTVMSHAGRARFWPTAAALGSTPGPQLCLPPLRRNTSCCPRCEETCFSPALPFRCLRARLSVSSPAASLQHFAAASGNPSSSTPKLCINGPRMAQSSSCKNTRLSSPLVHLPRSHNHNFAGCRPLLNLLFRWTSSDNIPVVGLCGRSFLLVIFYLVAQTCDKPKVPAVFVAGALTHRHPQLPRAGRCTPVTLRRFILLRGLRATGTDGCRSESSLEPPRSADAAQCPFGAQDISTFWCASSLLIGIVGACSGRLPHW